METFRPEVREFYRDYVPPGYVFGTVQMLLDSVPDKYVQGLDCVILTNHSGQARRDRVGKVTSRRRRVPQSRVLGKYHHANRGNPAWIELFVDKLAAPHPVMWFPVVRKLLFGSVLFHEIGHHIHTTFRPEYREKEDVANTWRNKLFGAFFRKRYWYLVPIRKPLALALRAMATNH